MVKNPNWRRQTSWLFAKRVGFEFMATEDKSIQWRGGGLEPGTPAYRSSALTTRPRSPPNNVLLLKICYFSRGGSRLLRNTIDTTNKA